MGRTLCPVVVGRERELACLDQALSDRARGRGSCLVIIGEAGIGKSRLTRELAQRADPLRVAIGRAVPSGGGEPYRPLTEALLHLVRGRDLPAESLTEGWRFALAPLLPVLTQSAPRATQVSAAVRADAVLRLIRLMAPSGAILVLEDLHWADPDTVGLIECLADQITEERLVLAVTARDEPGSAFAGAARRMWGRTGVVHLQLGRLTGAETARMAAACLADSPGEGRDVAQVQHSAEGIPLLVEELLASPGLPESIAETVAGRMAEMATEQRRVLEAAAALGRQFDWELLPTATGLTADVVNEALVAGVDRQLLSVEGDAFRFRHALTRDAVLGRLLPPRRREVAAAALAALDAAHPDLPGPLTDLASDLAVQAGQRERAGTLLHVTGRRALDRGALDTAVQTLERAAQLLDATLEQAQVQLTLVEVLALAGRVDEASEVGQRLIHRSGDGPEGAAIRLEAHLQLAQAAVSAARWSAATRQLEAARQLTAAAMAPGASARLALLLSEVELAAGRNEVACERAEEALAHGGEDEPEVRCHAFEILGRSCRLRDLAAARVFFEQGLAVAEAAGLPHWRLRALQEVGTIDMFDHVGVDRLIDALEQAEQAGAVATAASLDLQLTACFTARWELERADEHARSALERAERFRLEVVQAKALASLCATASMRADLDATETYARRVRGLAPDDQWLQGFCLINQGMALLMSGRIEDAYAPFADGIAVINRVPHGDPASARAVWPLLLGRIGDRRARSAIDQARRAGLGAFKLNQGLLAYAEAVLAGRDGEAGRAAQQAAAADGLFANTGPWLDLARLLAAEPAGRDGWGDPARWASSATAVFGRLGVTGLAALAPSAGSRAWPGSGITERESQVLELVARGRPNKEIASELGLSVRTVEKHLESLMRKTGTRSRTELAVGESGT